VATNIPFLQNLLRHPEFVADRISTRFVEEHAAELAGGTDEGHRRLFFEREPDAPEPPARAAAGRAGAAIDTRDPLAVLAHGKATVEVAREAAVPTATPDGLVAALTPCRAPSSR